MKILFFLASICLLVIFANAQTEQIENLIEEGVSLHDKGKYDEALKKYDKALKLDETNMVAIAEKSYTLMAMKKFDEAISVCKQGIKTDPDSKSLRSIYTNYALCLEYNDKIKEALKIYDEAINKFPDYYQLYFNKGITLIRSGEVDEAILSFEKSIMLNPNHASSHNAIGRIQMDNKKHIPALMALCRFLVIESKGDRAESNLTLVKEIMGGNSKKTGRNTITINVDADMLSDTSDIKKENEFGSAYLILAMSGALDFSKENKKKTEVELFIGKMETLCSMLAETRKDNYGFYWEYYAPYFIEMKEKELIEPFAYIVFASSDAKQVSKWISKNEKLLKDFYIWSSEYQWELKKAEE
ncbi:MAG: tetratricopeptide repeat protein [Saprospiraceae bacterium]|nr:tetratricopeptide repeat protein [Saprospiraceae bacterium]